MKSELKRFFSHRAVKWILFFIPLVLGFIGYCGYYSHSGKALTVSILSSVYSALRLFAFSSDASGTSTQTWYFWCLEIARYLAVFVMGAAILSILKNHIADLVKSGKSHRKNSIALHGSKAICSLLAENMDGYTVINNTESNEIFKAKEHILAFDRDEDAVKFLDDNYELLHNFGKSKIYFCTQSLNIGITGSPAVAVSHIPENCARLYWEKYWIKRFDKTAGDQNLKIVIIGFGNYGEAILSQALNVNVFFPDEPGIDYHVYGDGERYLLAHPMLDRFISVNGKADKKDSLFFHGTNEILTDRDIILDADRIIITDDDDSENYKALSVLCKAYASLPPIYIRLKRKDTVSAIYDPENAEPGDYLYGMNATVFGTEKELYTKDIIINNALYDDAKRINDWYGRTYGCPTPWSRLSAYNRLSSVASADHLSSKLRSVLKKECVIDAGSLAEYRKVFDKDIRNVFSEQEKLSELEHNRWCRFMYFNGWQFGDLPKEEAKKLRLHSDLVPFDTLSEEEKRKDMDPYLMLYEKSGSYGGSEEG